MIENAGYQTQLEYLPSNFKATDTIQALAIEGDTLCPAYWIGWARWEKVPKAWHVSRKNVDDDGNITFQDVTRPENVNVGITSIYSTSYYPQYMYNNIYFTNAEDEGAGVWRRFSFLQTANDSYTSINARLLNSFDINTILLTSYYLEMAIRYDDTYDSIFTITLTVDELKSKSWTKTITHRDVSFTVSASDLDGELKDLTIDGHRITFFCCGCGASYGTRPCRTDGGAATYFYPIPLVQIHDEDDRGYITSGALSGTRFINGTNGAGYLINTRGSLGTTGAAYDSVGPTYIYGFDGTIPAGTIESVLNSADMVKPSGANFVICGMSRSDLAYLRRIFDYDEIYLILSYQHKITNTDPAPLTAVYATDASMYYPHFSDENEFLGEIINGESDFDKLRPWQIAGTALDADSNDYKESDKPIYIPPDPDDRDKIGVSIDFNRTFPSGSATGLFTLYALRQVHLSKLGAKLWATLNDPNQNFWQNLQFAIGAFAETGSADISSVLEYITSIRIYPFALINLPGYANAGTGAIRLGTGKVALDLGTEGAGNVGIMGQYTGLIDAGSAYIPKHFEDFRDLEDVTISVYLPYIGNIQLNPAEVTGCTIAAEYAVDLTSGSCVAYLLLSGSWGFYPIGIYSGTIGADIPLTASQGNRIFARQIAAVISPILALSSATHTDSKNDDSGVSVSSALTAARTAVQAVQGLTGSSLTPPVLNGGGANFTGFGAPQTAYVQIRRAQYAYTARSFPAATFGNRTAQRATIGTLSGFTRCINPDVSKIPAPAAIQQSIKAKLEAGVYI